MAGWLYERGSPWVMSSHYRPWNRVRAARGMAALGPDLRRIYCDADHVLHPDIPGMFALGEPPAHHHFLGPLLWSPKATLPTWWEEVPDGRPVAYVTLGSSGNPALLGTIVAGLAEASVCVLASSAGAAPPVARAATGVFAADYLPGDAATARADFVVCNGGAMTCHQAFSLGKPVLGVASNMDQFLNMRGVPTASPPMACTGPHSRSWTTRPIVARRGHWGDGCRRSTPSSASSRSCTRVCAAAQPAPAHAERARNKAIRSDPARPNALLRVHSPAMPLPNPRPDPEELLQEWDAIVVGSGMGGATIGHALARAGKKVLFCELGTASAEARALRGG